MKTITTLLLIVIPFVNGFGQSNEPDTVTAYLASAKGIKKAEGYYTVIFRTLRSDREKAVRYLKEFESIAEKENDPVFDAYVHVTYGLYYSLSGKLDSAAIHFEDAKRIGKGKNSLLLIRTESSLGKVYIGLGKAEKGLENLFEALRLLQTNPNNESEIKVRINIMWAYLELKRYRDCIKFGRNAMQYVTPQYSWMLPTLYNNLAVSYGAENQMDSAHYFIEQSIPIAEANSDFIAIANGYFILGTAYSNSGKFSLAIEQYEKAKPYREKAGDPFYQVADLYTLSDLYARTGNYTKGIEAGLDGLRIAEDGNLTLKFEGVYQALAKNYEGQGDYKNASHYYNLWAMAKDSVYKVATTDAIAEMQTRYETEKKESLIREQKLELEKNQLITIGLVGLLILVVIVVVLWLNQAKLKEQKTLEQQQRKHQEELTKAVIQLQEKERSRFAKDLHDGFGQLITALKMQIEKVGLRTDGIPEVIQHMHDEIRNVSFALSPQVLVRDGLVMAIKELSFRINRNSGIQVSVQATGLNERLPADFEIALYRVCQEWINNVMKYSGANRADVQLIEHEDEVTLMIEDNGRGFDVSALSRSMGNGWKNIQSRIQILNGVVEVDSVASREGSTFTASIPKVSALLPVS